MQIDGFSRNDHLELAVHPSTALAVAEYAMVNAIRHQILSTLSFIAISAALILLAARLHHELPIPVSAQRAFDQQGNPAFSEELAMKIIKDLATFPDGSPRYRILGTHAMIEAEDYIVQAVEALMQDVNVNNPGMHEIELFRQTGSGNHVFEIMGNPSNKKYTNITNIVVRLSSGEASKKSAVLINAHTDSTLPSPGAADDLAGVAVMLETLRVMAKTKRELTNAVVFLFNGGEESLQDASHLFSTQFDPTIVKSLRSVINLEACGNAGTEIVFQATSAEMIKALSRTPRPYASTVASEVFASGLMLSDTDFRIFDAYANLTGLDMALVGNSYVYHTRLDTPENLEVGAIQHMGDNTLALLEYLTGNETSLGSAPDDGPLPKISPSSLVFSSFLGGRIFISYTRETATVAYTILFSLAAVVVTNQLDWDHQGPYLVGFFNVIFSLLSAVVSANAVAYFYAAVLGKTMIWFSNEYVALLIYGVPAALGALLSQIAVSSYVRTPRANAALRRKESALLQHSTLIAQLVVFASSMMIGHHLNVGSSFWLALATTSSVITLLINSLFAASPDLAFFSYIIGQLSPLLLGIPAFIGFLDIVIPLTGRLGYDSPVDHIAATIVAILGYLCLPMVLPFSHRFGHAGLCRLVIALVFISAATTGWYARPASQGFDAAHPRRLLALYMENITEATPVRFLHLAAIDPSPIESLIIEAVDGLLDVGDKLEAITAKEYQHEWEVIYPISEFLSAYKVPLPATSSDYVSTWKEKFTVTTTRSILNVVRMTRELSIEMKYPDLIWPSLSFEADIVSWEFPQPLQSGRARHHVKGVNGYGVDTLTLSLVIRLNEAEFEAAMREDQRAKGQRGDSSLEDQRLGLRIDFSALELDGMYPASVKPNATSSFRTEEEEAGSIGIQFFKEFEGRLGAEVDATLLSAVAGVAYL